MSAPEERTVTMSDGVPLKIDVYYPTGAPAGASFPVILAQTPYGKRSSVTTSGGGSSDLGGNGYYPYLVKRGYINVVADVRGTGSSGGNFQLFGPREVQDGVELVRFAASLAHSNGRVGTAGESYVGLNQIYTAAAIGPGSPLKAIFPVTAGNDLYRDLTFAGGIPNIEFALVWAGLRASMTGAVPDQPTGDPLALAEHPIQRAETYAGSDVNLYTEIDEGGPRAYDNDYWESRAPRNYLPQVVRNGIPAFLMSGWFDVYQRGVVLDYAELQNAWALSHPRRRGVARPRSLTAPMSPRQKPTARYQLVVGPWFHDPTGLGERYQQLMLGWFDTWLKGEPTGMNRTRTPLHVFELGPNRWVEGASYPIPAAKATSFYLDAGGALASRPPSAASGSDQLPWTSQTSPCNRGIDQWNTGLGTFGAALFGLPGLPACTNDDSTTQAASLTYTTAPFARDQTIAGPIGANLLVSSTAPDSELVATVEDVGPDGRSYPLTSGALLGSFRRLDAARSWWSGGKLLVPYHPFTQASAQPLEPGRVERMSVEVFPTFARIARGHRLRLTLSSGMTSLEPTPIQAQHLAGGVYSVERNRMRASQLDVPLADPAALPGSGTSYGSCNGGCEP